MKILFVTDLHGCRRKYDRLPELAAAAGVQMVINGGDMLPKDCDLHKQGDFIEGRLKNHFTEFESRGTEYVSCLGNDDLGIFDELFERTCADFEHVHNIAQKKIAIGGYEFVGMNWVTDYPFQLKDRCRMDSSSYRFQFQFGPGVLSRKQGWKQLQDWPAYARTLPTIEDELQSLPHPQEMSRTIYVVHMPPAGVGLDVCGSGEEVGSAAVARFLEENQPLLSLHGHIHESPEVTGEWQARIGRTLCVQPGQTDRLCYVLIDLGSMEAERVVAT